MKRFWLAVLFLVLPVAVGCSTHSDRYEAESFLRMVIVELQTSNHQLSPKEFSSNDTLGYALLQRPCLIGDFSVVYVDESLDEYMFDVNFETSKVHLSMSVYRKSNSSGYQITRIEFFDRDLGARQRFRECLGEQRYQDWLQGNTDSYLPRI